MALENAQWIAELVPANPEPGDVVGQGDDHMRLTKTVLANTFVGDILNNDRWDSTGGALTVGPAGINNLYDMIRAGGGGITVPVTMSDLAIADGGTLVVGHDSPLSIAGTVVSLQVLGAAGTAEDSRMLVGRWGTDSNGPEQIFYKSRNAVIGSSTIVQLNDFVGISRYRADDGAGGDPTVAFVSVRVDGTPAAGIVPGRWSLETANAAGALTTALVVDSNQDVEIPNGKLTVGQGGDFLTGDLRISAGTLDPRGNVSAGDAASVGYTVDNGLELIGNGNTYDVSLFNNTGTVSLGVVKGTGNITIPNGSLTVDAGTAKVTNAVDISPVNAVADGVMRLVGNGYTTYFTMDATASYIGINSSARKLIFQVNLSDALIINNGNRVDFTNGIQVNSGAVSMLNGDLTVADGFINVTGTGSTSIAFIPDIDGQLERLDFRNSANANRSRIEVTVAGATSQMIFYTGSLSQAMSLDTNGNMTITGGNLTVLGGGITATDSGFQIAGHGGAIVTRPAFTFANALTTGIYLSAPNIMGIAANGVQAMTLSATTITIPNGDLTVSAGVLTQGRNTVSPIVTEIINTTAGTAQSVTSRVTSDLASLSMTSHSSISAGAYPNACFIGSNGAASGGLVLNGQAAIGVIIQRAGATVATFDNLGVTVNAGDLTVSAGSLKITGATGVTIPPANGSGDVATSTGNGLMLIGKGSSTDVAIYNQNGSSFVEFIANTRNAVFKGLVTTGIFSTIGASFGVQMDAAAALTASSVTGTGTASHYAFYNPNGQVGTINTNANATLFNVSSDPRLKSSFRKILNSLDVITQAHDLDIIGEFDWLSDGQTDWGYNAHKLIDLQPNFGGSEGEGDRTAELGDTVTPAGVDKSKRVPILEAAIYELLQRVITLEPA